MLSEIKNTNHQLLDNALREIDANRQNLEQVSANNVDQNQKALLEISKNDKSSDKRNLNYQDEQQNMRGSKVNDDPHLDKENVKLPPKQDQRSLKKALKSKSPEKPSLNADLQVQNEEQPEVEKEAVQDNLMSVDEPQTEQSNTSSTTPNNIDSMTPEEDVAQQSEIASGEANTSTIQNDSNSQENQAQIEDKEPLEENKPLPNVDNPPNTVKDIEKLADEIIQNMTQELTADQKHEIIDAQRKTEELQKEKDELRDILNKIKIEREQRTHLKAKEAVNVIQEIGKVLEVDTQVMNFNTYLPGKLLGSTLMVTNLTDCEQIIELSVDSQNYKYYKSEIKKQFEGIEGQDSKLPFDFTKNSMVNSEIKFESWFIENPVSKELTKRITLKLGPKAEQDFIIVVRSPQIKKSENMMSLINIGLLTYGEEEFGLKHSFEDFLQTHYDNSMKSFLNDRKSLAQVQKQQILLAGRIQVPKIYCQKEIVLNSFNQSVIPLAIKRNAQQPIQKFRFPFKNLAGNQDLEVEFQFMKTCAAFNIQDKESNFVQSQTASPIEFSVQPSTVKIGQSSPGILNVTAKIKNSYMMQQENSARQKNEFYNHLLIARVKDTNIMFSFVIQAALITSSQNTVM